MIRNITDIVGELVGRVSVTVVAERLETIGTTTKFWTCDVGYARVGGTLGGLVITEIGSNFIIVEGSLVGLTQSLKAPTYKLGTVIQVNNENLSATNNQVEPYPMIYFPEFLGSITYYRGYDIREMTASIRLIFADRYNQDWTAEEFTQKGITPMLQLFERFKKVVESDPFISPLGVEWDVKHIPILGSYAADKGYKNDWFNDKVGGIVVDATIDIYKRFECKCCGCDIPDAPAEIENFVDNNGDQFIDNNGNDFVVVN